MVAAEIDPERLVFVDEMGLHTSLAPLYSYPRKGENACTCRFHVIAAVTPRWWP